MYKSWWKKLDYVLIFLMLILVVFGFIIIYSANSRSAGGGNEFHRQLIFFFVGLVLMIVVASIDYELLSGFELYLYIFNLALLALVLFVGREALGAQRWIKIGFFSFQPSEFSKLFIILSMATRLSKEDALKTENVTATMLYLGVPLVLIMIQPDLGTSLVLLAIFFAMLYIRGFNLFYILGFCAAGLAVAPFVLKEYQMQRLTVFLNPNSDPTGAGWNVIQSIVGIGSGKIWGKGLFSGTLTQLEFVPEHSTDFIFSVLGEELGFVGGASLIILYFLLLWRMVKIGKESKNLLGTLIAVGITAMFFFHIFVNIGMTMGIMPATGIPLPFVSYGGSSLVTCMMAVGLLQNIAVRRELFFKK